MWYTIVMIKHELKIGDRFGKLTVLEILQPVPNRRQIKCICDCGKEYLAIRNHLVIGKAKSCGCKRGVQDISGHRFGRLLVQEFDYSDGKQVYWKCLCDCGNVIIKNRTILNNGDAKSCGCLLPRITGMIGKKFGRLTVQELVKAKKGQKWYSCVCECGVEKVIDGHSLRRGHTTSCGCLQPEVASKLKVTNRNEQQKYASYRSGANVRNLSFDLSYKEFIELTAQNCHYCGSEPNNKMSTKNRKDDFVYNGIDRLNNTLGYSKENCVPCCKLCNRIKGIRSTEDFKNHAMRVFLFTHNSIKTDEEIKSTDYLYPCNHGKKTALNKVRSYYKSNAKIKNREFSLSDLEFYWLITNSCSYCGTQPVTIKNYVENNELKSIKHNGIDRVNNSLGYNYENSKTCCTDCNRAKGDLHVSEFKAHMLKIAEFLIDMERK